MSSVDSQADVDATLTVPQLSDSLDQVGVRRNVLQGRLSAVVPGMRALGRARTIQFAPSSIVDDADPYRAAITALDAIQPGDLIVVATDGNDDSAVWGELFSAAAMGAGAVGMVTDGNVRDTPKIAALGFPVFARSRRPIDYRGRLQIVATDVPVRLGGVTISPRDLVAADDDGVVAVPACHEDAVLTAARARASGETTVLRDLLAGDSLSAVWARTGIL